MTSTPFTPGETVSLATSTSSGRVALGKPTGGAARIARVANTDVTAANFVYIKFGDVTVAATTGDMPIAANSVGYFQVPEGATHIAAIAAAATPALRITTGYGGY